MTGVISPCTCNRWHTEKIFRTLYTNEMEMMTKRVNKTVINLKKKRIDVSGYSWVTELIDNFI